ncbi:hypothetical protein [Clostridium chrysemydis]|uniref:hypothetical protein n=1 Tax=Clostridium chrysemydis TaxID=2665504 RepID=UPI0018834E1A|nr:hypothetical protein [Clostridium chrysemydis]
MNKKKVIVKLEEEKFVEEVLNSIKVKGMTITNTKEAMQKVYNFMEDNANLKMDYLEN